ncbi:MAG: SRPBCC domain-containing protein [Thermoproteota archaeon]
MTDRNNIVDFKFTIDRKNKKVIMERIFDAPPELVFRAHTDAELIPKWWTNTKVAELDVRVGGKWRFVSNWNGQESVSSGEFKEIVPNEKIVETFNIGFAETINTTTFEEISDEEDKTKLTKIVEFSRIEDLENLVKYGMEQGARTGYERIAGLLSELIEVNQNDKTNER